MDTPDWININTQYVFGARYVGFSLLPSDDEAQSRIESVIERQLSHVDKGKRDRIGIGSTLAVWEPGGDQGQLSIKEEGTESTKGLRRQHPYSQVPYSVTIPIGRLSTFRSAQTDRRAIGIVEKAWAPDTDVCHVLLLKTKEQAQSAMEALAAMLGHGEGLASPNGGSDSTSVTASVRTSFTAVGIFSLVDV